MKRIYIGIDLGKKGAIVVMDNEKNLLLQLPTPMIRNEIDWFSINELIERYKDKNVVVTFEKIGIIHGSSKITAFSMGGQLQGMINLCIAHKVRYETVPPKKWQEEIFGTQLKIYIPNTKRIDTKAMALVAYRKLYPDRDIKFTDRQNKAQDGLIDAALICEYAYRKFPR